MKMWVLLVFLIPVSLLSQINIHKAGDGWDSIVRSALNLIQKTSPEHYNMIVSQVEEIEFWNEAYSSNAKTSKKGVIVISSKDIALNSINNLAAVIVHENYHLGNIERIKTYCEKDVKTMIQLMEKIYEIHNVSISASIR